jgi:AcrR family transcriptional regulator
VVRGALEATLEGLAEHGYDALRIEDVATRAGVNKTTIYRRWPTKADLVRAALLSITSDGIVAPRTGSLRGDLLSLAWSTVELIRSCEGRGLFRMLQTAGPESELMAICMSLKERHEVVPRAVVEEAAARGEIRPSVDPMLIFTMLGAAVHHHMVMNRSDADERFVHHLVDLLLHGALRPTAPKRPGAKQRAKGTRPPPRRAARAKRGLRS